VLQGLKASIQKAATTLLTERLDPASAAAAVFWGVFIGIVPIYGLQTLAAIGVALLLRLNKPLTLACTFINNPLLLPPTVAASVELGSFVCHGSFRSWHMVVLSGAQLKEQLFSWVLGSLLLGMLLGGAACASAFASSIAPLPNARNSTAVLFAGRCAWTGFFPCWPARIWERERWWTWAAATAWRSSLWHSATADAAWPAAI
jgi:uncharacterized protein (DUF2062 family)